MFDANDQIMQPSVVVQALQTRDTLERLERSLVAFTMRERRLSARLAIEAALGSD